MPVRARCCTAPAVPQMCHMPRTADLGCDRGMSVCCAPGRRQSPTCGWSWAPTPTWPDRPSCPAASGRGSDPAAPAALQAYRAPMTFSGQLFAIHIAAKAAQDRHEGAHQPWRGRAAGGRVPGRQGCRSAERRRQRRPAARAPTKHDVEGAIMYPAMQ
jgi:hypothetical protein